MPLKRFITTIAIAVICSAACGQDSTVHFENKQDSINALLKCIRKQGGLESSATGPAGSPSRQYYRFALLDELSTDDDLILLTSDSSAAVRVYALAALVYRKNPNASTIIKRFSTDSSNIGYISGCVISSKPVRELLKDDFFEYFYHGRDGKDYLSIYMNHPKLRPLVLLYLLN